MSTINGGWRGSNIVKDGLVLYLDAGSPNSFYAPTAGTTWKDISGNRNNATLVNGPAYTGSNGGSIVFDGTNDTVSFSSSFNATTAGLNGYHSVDLWVYLDTQPGVDSGLFTCNNTGGLNGYMHYIVRSSRFHLGWYSVDVTSTTPLTTNTWYNVVFMFDTDNKQKIYINGAFNIESVVRNTPFNGGTAGIGMGYYNGYYKGLIPITKVYNRPLSATEIRQNYNATKARFGL